MRDIFRRLASALHPDRVTDDAERVARTAMMQRVNQAYAANDLLALLELQLEIEQIDPGHIATASAARLKHDNQVLQEQLAELRLEIQRTETDWRNGFGMSICSRPDPFALERVLWESERQWREELATMQVDIRRLSDAKPTKEWLKGERRRLKTVDWDRTF